MSTTPLEMVEKNDLQYHEQRIEKGLNTFIQVGESLAKIRDSSLYRETHDTFEAYCRERWGFTASRARQLCGAAEVAESVTNVTLSTESQARELAKVEPEKREEVVHEARERWGGITARSIREAAEVTDEPKNPSRPDLETRRFDAFKIELEFLRFSRRIAKITTETRHEDLMEVAIQGIAKGIAEGAEYRKSKKEGDK